MVPPGLLFFIIELLLRFLFERFVGWMTHVEYERRFRS